MFIKTIFRHIGQIFFLGGGGYCRYGFLDIKFIPICVCLSPPSTLDRYTRNIFCNDWQCIISARLNFSDKNKPFSTHLLRKSFSVLIRLALRVYIYIKDHYDISRAWIYACFTHVCYWILYAIYFVYSGFCFNVLLFRLVLAISFV